MCLIIWGLLVAVAHHIDGGSQDQQFIIEMFKGNMVGSLKRIADAGQLTDWHMSLATAGIMNIGAKCSNF